MEARQAPPTRGRRLPAMAVLAAAAAAAAAVLALGAAPGEAAAQAPDRIALLAAPAEYERGDSFFVFGRIAQVDSDSYLIIQAVNPHGNICRIQQITPLSGGLFLSEAIPLTGRMCGAPGEYDIRLFYGDHRAAASFTLLPTLREAPSPAASLQAARSIVEGRIDSLSQSAGDSAVSPYRDRLADEGLTVAGAAGIYADLWADLDVAGDGIYEIGATFRPAVESALSAVSRLVADGDLSAQVASDISRVAYEAAFYHALGDTASAVSRLSDVFVSVQNVDPVKIEPRKQRTYAELEQSVQNLMTKTSATLSDAVKEELALIFARGTAPLHADELDEMLDMMTKMRYLDITSRRNGTLYSIVQDEWAPLSESVAARQDVESVLELHAEADALHRAALMLRDLDGVSRFMGTDGAAPPAGAPPAAAVDRGALVEIMRPAWDGLAADLGSATAVGDILAYEQRARDLKGAIEISGRITKVVEIARANNAGADMVDGWNALLGRVGAAASVPAILAIVSEFDASLAELRERRGPIDVLRFEYESMLARAEMQADHDNAAKIRTALRILDSAEDAESGRPSASRIDRIEVLLAWASDSAPTIRAELDAYSGDAHNLRAGDILRRAKSIENLVDLSMRGNRFAPGFAEFAASVEGRLETARNLVIGGELDKADGAVRSLFDEWQTVSGAYAEDPSGAGGSGYSIDGLKRADIRKRIGALAAAASNFYSADFAPHAAEYERLRDAAYEAADYGNFVDAESGLAELGAFLEEHLALTDPRIIYEIDYDGGHDTWVLSGHLDKTSPLREKITVTVYRGDSAVHSSLRFTDTREGAFYTQWRAPAEPGLYVVMLEWSGSGASRLLYVADEPSFEYSQADADASSVAREFAELEAFAGRFGSAASMGRIDPMLSEIRTLLAGGNAAHAAGRLDGLRAAIDRYLPERSRDAVIDAQYGAGQLVVSGAVLKTLTVSEDLFVDVYDESGGRVHEIALRDTATGHFSEAAAIALAPGLYVVELHYHGLATTDFFIVGGAR